MSLTARRGKAVVLRALALAVLVVIVIAGVIVAWLVRSPLPKVNGTLAVAGISAPVTIRRDDRGIPHIEASTEADLMFGEGFACAQDRLWQIDLLRRTAEGKLSEVAGAGAIGIDRYMRTLGLAEAAQRDAAALRGQARLDFEAYAAGVNAAAASHPLPVEFRLLGYRPQPWVASDSLVIIKLMAQRLDDQWSQLELRALLQRRIGVRAADSLMDTHVPGLEHFISGSSPPSAAHAVASSAALHRSPENDARALAGAGAWTYTPPLPPQPQNGSNNWVIAGRLVTTGKPVLSNDTHLEHSVPSTYWLAQLQGAGMDVEGFIIPGIPFIALGHNARIAFGVTSGDPAVQDLYIERFRSPSSDEYLADGRWLKAAHRYERIEIKGQNAQILDVLVTRHGPVMSRAGVHGNALAWTILRGGSEAELLRRLDRASNWAQFEDALSQVVGPAFNWAYADVDGDIGYHLAAKIPKRLHGDGSVPVEGEDDRYAWQGYLPFDSLPHTYNPRAGYVATANNRLAPPDTPVGSSTLFDAPYRLHEIYRRLGQRSRFTPQQAGNIQTDVYDYPRALLATQTARILAATHDARLRLIGSQLAAWDGEAGLASTAPTFLMAEQRALERALVIPKLGPYLAQRYDKDFNAIVPLERVLEHGDQSLLSIGVTRATLAAAIPAACVRAADELGATEAHGIAGIETWGASNEAVFDHPAGKAWPLRALFNIKTFAQAGDGFTVYAAKPDHGPASRLVADLSDWDDSMMLLTLGESGLFNDAHYQDQVEDFAAVRWVTLPFSDAAVAAATKDILTLHP